MVERLSFVATLVSVILASTTAALEGSRTLPEIEPVAVWAEAVPAASQTPIAKSPALSLEIGLRRMRLPHARPANKIVVRIRRSVLITAPFLHFSWTVYDP